MPMLNPWPLWSQLNDWTADGRPDENRNNNCGPESVAECLKYLTNIELPADYIKDVMYGEGYTGGTDLAHMGNFLDKYCGISCVYASAPQLRTVVQGAIDAEHPIIVLYYFTLADKASGHFSPVIAYDSKGCTRANVWNRALETWDWATFERWQKGYALVLNRSRAIGRGPDTLRERLLELKRKSGAA